MSTEARPAEENKNTVRRFYEEIFGQGENLELATLEAIFDDEYVLHDRDQDPAQAVQAPPAGIDPVRGPAGIKAWVKSFRYSFPDLQVKIKGNPMAVEGNRVVTRFELRGTFEEARADWEGMSLSKFSEEGKITESWSYWESGRMYEQLGYFKMMPTTTIGDPHDWRRPPRGG